MTELEILLSQRERLISELGSLQHPAMAIILLLMAMIAIIGIFIYYWRIYSNTITGSIIVGITMVSISAVSYIYMENHIERQEIQRELQYVEKSLIYDFDYDL